MTRQEAIAIIRKEYSCVDRDCDIERSCGKCPYSMSSKEPILKAYCLAVEALEQLTSYEQTINKLTEAISEQEPRKGHWILDETDNSITCDKCGCLIWANDISNGEAYYCPNCGAKMIEPQESEVQDAACD